MITTTNPSRTQWKIWAVFCSIRLSSSFGSFIGGGACGADQGNVPAMISD